MPTDFDVQLEKSLDAIMFELVELSHDIHAHPELAFQEHYSSQVLANYLASHGFSVQRNVAGMETAFVASAGSGEMHIGICAEYDALPDVGHACGHNIIAAAAIGAGTLLAPLANALGITVRVFGTPAEEGGGGKILMLDDGLFEDIDAAMMVHPAPAELDRMASVAAQHLEISYVGKEAHAAAFPNLGINALDAMTIAQVAIGLLRQSLLPDEMIHGIIKHGGDAPNIIPAHVSAHYIVRADTLGKLEKLLPRVKACFEAGAVATGATLTFGSPYPPYSEIVTDETMATIWRSIVESRGRTLMPPGSADLLRASTDMGNVSRVVPSIHPIMGIESLPAVNHQPEFTAAAIGAGADRAVIDGAFSMAALTVKIATDATLRERYLGGKQRTKLRESLGTNK